MNVITFPQAEWHDIKERLRSDKKVWTVRVDQECGKYQVGDIVKTQWGQKVEIISLKKIRRGIAELREEYDFFSDLTQEMITELHEFNEMDIISLKRCTGVQ